MKLLLLLLLVVWCSTRLPQREVQLLRGILQDHRVAVQ